MYLVRFFSKYPLSHLSKLQYSVTQNKDTEAPFSSELLYNKEKGNYSCIVCSTELFSSISKFDSGSGWPSFYDCIDSKRIIRKEDYSHGLRVEILCAICNSHLGHHFPDGPYHSRYCINGCALTFDKLNI